MRRSRLAPLAALALLAALGGPARAEGFFTNDPLPGGARARASLFAGGSFRRLYDVPVYGAEFTLSIGRENRWVTIGPRVDFFVGDTRFHERALSFAVTVWVEAKVGRLRFGGGAGPGYLRVDRITSPEDPGEAGLMRLLFTASLDVLTWSRRRGALYLGFQGGWDTIDASVLHATVGLGLRP